MIADAEARIEDPFTVLRAYLDKVESIADSTFSTIPAELRNRQMHLQIRAQFAREAVRQMVELVK